jgi:transposase
LEARIAELEALNAAQAAQIEVLMARVAELEARLDPTDSGNSSLPPSRDGRSRRQRRAEEREARKRVRGEDGGEKRSPGKQPGAPGSTLERRTADFTERYQPPCCERCTADLSDAVVVGEVTRQVLDVPEPRLIATDHVAEKRRCGCGHTTTAGFPPEATAPVCWGPRTKAVAVYLMIRQHIPLERAQEAMAVLFAAPVSQGSLAAWPLETAERLSPFTAALRALLAVSAAICADETPIRVGTSTGYVHTASTESLTFLAYHACRGIDAINDIGLLRRLQGHDHARRALGL